MGGYLVLSIIEAVIELLLYGYELFWLLVIGILTLYNHDNNINNRQIDSHKRIIRQNIVMNEEPSIFGTLAKDKSPARDENKRRSMPQTPSFANLFKAVEGESTMPKMCNGHVTSSETSSNVVESEEIEKDKEIIVKIAFIR
ncbi:uncharacterized protein LOC117112352 isoform X1 [Anneissia japonica]|uniref:uncharacterized protein LOC117112352 isoform X1 n=1 Tax=Anneissia japonica TaxID=1529436 RepID=UPI0014258D93|nr:uncharacterized protein LOC117112352 isoform X1 [Anneissia japonica]